MASAFLTLSFAAVDHRNRCPLLAIEQIPVFGYESDRMLKDPPRGYQTPNPARGAFPTGTMPILSARVGKATPGRFEAQRMTDRGGTGPATRQLRWRNWRGALLLYLDVVRECS